MPYHHFTREERYVISHLKLEGFSLREIGRRLGRHYTSISREIMRNRPTYADDAVYWYYVSQPFALERTLTSAACPNRRQPRARRSAPDGVQ